MFLQCPGFGDAIHPPHSTSLLPSFFSSLPHVYLDHTASNTFRNGKRRDKRLERVQGRQEGYLNSRRCSQEAQHEGCTSSVRRTTCEFVLLPIGLPAPLRTTSVDMGSTLMYHLHWLAILESETAHEHGRAQVLGHTARYEVRYGFPQVHRTQTGMTRGKWICQTGLT